MGKQKSDLVSDMMCGAQIIKAISDALRDRGGNDNCLKKILGEHSLFPGRIADLLMEQEQKPARQPHPSDAIAAEYGFTVLEDVQPSDFQIKDLEMVPFLKPEDGGNVIGTVMRTRAVTLKANLGLTDAKHLLKHKEEIPVEFRGKYLVFTGTLLRDSGGVLLVAYLFWNGVCWLLNFRWVDFVWDGGNRLLRCKSQQS